MAVLLGPNRDDENGGVEKIHRETKIDILLCPPPTSPSQIMASILPLHASNDCCQVQAWPRPEGHSGFKT